MRLIAFRTILDSVERRSTPSLSQKSNPALSVVHPVAFPIYRKFCNVLITVDVDAGRGGCHCIFYKIRVYEHAIYLMNSSIYRKLKNIYI
jgi:hypothetical protein